MLQDVDIFSWLRMIAGALTVFAGFHYLLNRGDEAGEPGEAEERWRPAPGQYDLVPRTLPQNPFTQSQSLERFGSEIEAAAEASVRHSRTIGLIYFEFPALSAVEREPGAEATDDLIGELADDFRRAVRATDHVCVLDKTQIVVAICLLSGRKDLETISARLSAAARRRGAVEELAPSLPVGLAIYPVDGYRGLELIESARRRYRELSSEASQGVSLPSSGAPYHALPPQARATHAHPRLVRQ